MLQHEMQLYAADSHIRLPFSGQVIVTPAGSRLRQAIYDTSDVLLTGKSLSFTGGTIKFRTLESVNAVDIYGITQYGYTFQLRNVTPGSVPGIYLDLQKLINPLVIPFHFTDLGAAGAEYTTGINLLKNVPVLGASAGAGVLVEALDSGMTLDVGTNSTTGTDDPNGFFAALSLTTAVFKQPGIGYTIGTNSILVDVTGGTAEWTLGELFSPANTKSASKAEGTDSTTTKNGIYFTQPYVPGGGTASLTEEVTITPSSSLDTGVGLVILPLLVTSFPSF